MRLAHAAQVIPVIGRSTRSPAPSGVERVCRGDDFFVLGGHSLLAVQMISRVRQAMDVELALGAVFETPVLSALADRILDLRLARFDPETLARLTRLVREPGAQTT